MSGQGNPFRGIRSGLLDLGPAVGVVQIRKPIFKEGEVYCIQASELEIMARFSRMHNIRCPKRIEVSEEDGRPYCRYRVRTDENQISQGYTLECRECGHQEKCNTHYNE